ncbi:uncharacterized protein LOC122020500 [Zingiber officinale]|uniref:uncharacterized protein LOC122020500 n=1 Tax=Zingiber officinale TaxID=94328 RepID=UPI001C4BFD31|nr:uncharacterized protein LOC122020500 [Zingiber officinale]
MASVPSENPSQRRWSFTWETLSYIPTLRLYLFHPDVDPSARCRNLAASLRLDQFVILVSWIEDGGGNDVGLRVPVPRVLIDPSCRVDCRATSDHVEIKLALVLPLDNPAVSDLLGVLDPGSWDTASGAGGVSNRSLPLSLDSDIKNLSAGAVDFFCKSCSTKLTKQHLRQFVEMPSVNWQEVADNWFGNCCCSFGGASEKIVSQYVNKYDCSAGTCLLDSASIILCQDDLEGYTIQDLLTGYPDHQNNEQASNGVRIDSANGSSYCEFAEDVAAEALDFSSCKMGGACIDLAKVTPVQGDTDHVSFPKLTIDEMLSTEDANFLNLHSDYCCGKSEKHFLDLPNTISSDGHCHNCDDKMCNVLNHTSGGSMLGPSAMPSSQKWPHNKSLGGGFIVPTSNFSHDVKWVNVLCKNCSSLIGCNPSSRSANVPLDGGIRLFKFCISTCASIGRTGDIFRNHTLQRVFANLLLESAEDELSYRIIVRDMNSGTPMLLLVFLSSKSWSSSGYCMENVDRGPLPSADLQPFLKVLFSDCSIDSKASARIIEDWSTRNHAEEVYMLTHLIEELTVYLKSAFYKLPPSCSSLQGMSLSSLER